MAAMFFSRLPSSECRSTESHPMNPGHGVTAVDRLYYG